MSRRLVGILLVLTFGLGAVIGGVTGVLLFIREVGGTGEPSAPISAPTLSLDMLKTPTPAVSELATQVAQVATGQQAAATQAARNGAGLDALAGEVAAINEQMKELGTLVADQRSVPSLVQGASLTPSRTPRPTLTPSMTLTSTVTLTPSATALPGQILFRIVPEESEARFIVDELKPFIVGLVGRTDQVAGDIIVDFDHPPNSRLGIIRINMRTFRTPDRDRDESIRCCILRSVQPALEFSDFVPTSISGLPERITQGEAINFQISGDFPIRAITRPLTFDVTLTAVSRSEIRGLARAIIQRSDYGLLDGGVVEHGVAEEVMLELEFVARAVELWKNWLLAGTDFASTVYIHQKWLNRIGVL